MKIGMEEDMGVADEMALSVWDRASAARVITREAHQNTLIWMDCSENWHEGGHVRCRRNGVVGFGIARVRRA